jgi:UDP-N-acetylglucosamine--N-acetylmuramyl-(pentapeptide) pyrophosphoryl-undecaprenol N-acetylglucosamine transferase
MYVREVIIRDNIFPVKTAEGGVSGTRSLHAGKPAQTTTNRAIRVVVAGGGTGGHLFPGIAVAEEVMARNPDSRILFVGTGRKFETSVLKANGYRHATIKIQGLKGRGLWNQFRTLLQLPLSLVASARILNDFEPDFVMGVGGYSAGPVVVAARFAGIRTAIQEQNVLPGITNRMLSRFADRLYLSFEETRGLAATPKAVVTGNPVRREFLSMAASTDRSPPSQVARFTVLVAGGSQGAHAINMAMLDTVALLGQPGRFSFIHQTGTADENQVRTAYARARIDHTVKAFFSDMARQYQKADLVICRAGATSVAELTVLGKPVIFVPYPFAADDHQRLNAESLVKAGAAEMITQEKLNGPLLAERIGYYAKTPGRLSEMALRAGKLGRPNAARDIVDDMYDLIGR